MDPAWNIWRDKATAAAVGYIPQNSFAVIFGSPLCPAEQIPRVAKAFLAFVHEEGLKPVWCCVDKSTERYLAEELGWAAVLAVAEERINATEMDPAAHDKTVRRKIHRAEREGVRLVEVGQEMDPTVRAQLEQRCRDWEARRKGTQIHLTGVRPFDDVQHRKYFYAVDKTGKVRSYLCREPRAASAFCSSAVRRVLMLMMASVVAAVRDGRACPACAEAWLPDQVGARVPWGTARRN